MKKLSLAILLAGINLLCVEIPAAKAHHHTSYPYQISPEYFRQKYRNYYPRQQPVRQPVYSPFPGSQPNYFPYHPSSRRASGCSAVDDQGDYDAMSQIDSRNYPRIYRVQQQLSPGQCAIIKIDAHHDYTYLAIDAHSIRWATGREIEGYRR